MLHCKTYLHKANQVCKLTTNEFVTLLTIAVLTQLPCSISQSTFFLQPAACFQQNIVKNKAVPILNYTQGREVLGSGGRPIGPRILNLD